MDFRFSRALTAILMAIPLAGSAAEPDQIESARKAPDRPFSDREINAASVLDDAASPLAFESFVDALATGGLAWSSPSWTIDEPNGTARMKIGMATNIRYTTTGSLRLELWASAKPPGSGGSGDHHVLAFIDSSPWPARISIPNIDTGVLPLTAPPNGKYWLTMAVLESFGGPYVVEVFYTFATQYTFGGPYSYGDLLLELPLSYYVDVPGKLASMQAFRIRNATSRTSGRLKLKLSASVEKPIFGETISSFTVASVEIDALGPNASRLNYDSGALAAQFPNPGPYYVSILLLQQSSTDGNWYYTALYTFPERWTMPSSGTLTADFAYSPAQPRENESVAFSDSSSGNPTRWSWTFGDGGTSTERNPSHVFTKQSTYTVVLTASNATESSQKARDVIVSAPPTPALDPHVRMFVNGVDSCQGSPTCNSFAARTNDSLTAWAYDTSTSAAIPSSAGTFSWDFGSAGSPSPATGSGNGVGFSYRSTGSTTVALTFTPNGGSPVVKTISGVITTNVTSVQVVASAYPMTVQTAQAVTFSASASGGTGGFTYSWAFSDGGTGTGAYVSKSFATAGSHYGAVTVRDSAGSTASGTAYVTVQSATPTYNLEIKVLVNGADPCAGGGGPGGGLLACAFTVKSNDDQLTAMAYNNGALLYGGTFAWTFGGPAASPSTGNSNQFPFKYTGSGTASVGLTWTPSGGSPVVVSPIAFTVVPGGAPALAVAVAAEPASAYVGTAITFTATPSGGSGIYADYSWVFGDGQTGAGDSVRHTYTTAGNYSAVCVVRDSLNAVAYRAVSVVISAAPVAPMWMVPGVAWADGQNGALWQSDLSVFNPDPVNPMSLRMALLDGSVSSLDNVAWSGWVRLQPRETRTYSNVLQGVFGVPKGRSGAILVQNQDLSPTYLPVMSARTYDAARGDLGTVGLSLVTVPLQATRLPGGGTHGIGPALGGAGYELIGLSDDDICYTNLGVANLLGDTVRAELRLETFENGTRVILGSPVPIELPPYGIRNYTNVLADAAGYTGKPVHSYRATVQLLQGTAILPYASIIDRTSKSPALMTPAWVGSSALRLPGVVRAQGQNGSLWRSDLTLYNPSEAERLLRITYSYRSSMDPARLQGKMLYLQARPHDLLRMDDFVKLWLELDESDSTSYTDGIVDVVPQDGSTEPLHVTGRTYNNQPTGNVALGVPAFVAADGISQTTSLRRLILAGLRCDDSYRSNIAVMLANLEATSPASVRATAKVYDYNGNLLTTRSFELSAITPFQQFSVDELVQGFSPQVRASLSVIVEDVVGAPLLTGYATVIDRRSGGAVLCVGAPAL